MTETALSSSRMCISLEQMHSLARKLRGMIRREMVEPASQLMNLYEAAERLGCLGSVGCLMSEPEFRSFTIRGENSREIVRGREISVWPT